MVMVIIQLPFGRLPNRVISRRTVSRRWALIGQALSPRSIRKSTSYSTAQHSTAQHSTPFRSPLVPISTFLVEKSASCVNCSWGIMEKFQEALPHLGGTSTTPIEIRHVAVSPSDWFSEQDQPGNRPWSLVQPCIGRAKARDTSATLLGRPSLCSPRADRQMGALLLPHPPRWPYLVWAGILGMKLGLLLAAS